MDLKSLTVEQLKGMAYDQVKLLEQTRQNIAVLEQEIKAREEAPKEDKKK